ncbi:Uu.00g070540.m01.CDS01 [Anthostomella pinea]|uniref:Uu.00g070540.m01.CDS01 n=1 Tax=Anthostomella pinea TaxID=933095 RepID=A0AAI8VVI1_9PEZI|nr:Uu.00g070540.m01.CDS01 [Anthostomella pinea]
MGGDLLSELSSRSFAINIKGIDVYTGNKSLVALDLAVKISVTLHTSHARPIPLCEYSPPSAIDPSDHRFYWVNGPHGPGNRPHFHVTVNTLGSEEAGKHMSEVNYIEAVSFSKTEQEMGVRLAQHQRERKKQAKESAKKDKAAKKKERQYLGRRYQLRQKMKNIGTLIKDTLNIAPCQPKHRENNNYEPLALDSDNEDPAIYSNIIPNVPYMA